jgi:sentrin-specific protease 1
VPEEASMNEVEAMQVTIDAMQVTIDGLRVELTQHQVRLAQYDNAITITFDDYDRFKRILNRPPDHDVITRFNITMKQVHFACLGRGRWLNDMVVDFFFAMLAVRDTQSVINGALDNGSYFVGSFFYTQLRCHGYEGVRRWNRGVELFGMEKVFVPINVNNVHWILAVIDMPCQSIVVYDSIGATGQHHAKRLLEYLTNEMKDKLQQELAVHEWTLTTVAETPLQANGHDCGAFMCIFAYYLSQNTSLCFVDPFDMNTVRAFIGMKVLDGEL